MSTQSSSPLWYRVAGVRPALAVHAELSRHIYRGQTWHVVRNRLNGRLHRISESAYALIGRLDGKTPVQDLWDATQTTLEDSAPTQSEAIELLAQLHSADLIRSDVPPDTDELFRRYQRGVGLKWKGRLRNPLAIRVRLWDPDKFLVRWEPWVRPWFTPVGAIVCCGVFAIALLLAAAHWTELTENVSERLFTQQNLLLLWLTYPFVKVLHELGHGFATKVWGGEVHEMGVIFIALVPVPYVDATSASAFPEARQRILVSAAGILVELLLAALALFLWLNVEAGTVRALAYNVMLIGAASTLFVNGNPLLRFDGYYLLCDAVGIPNLGSRSTRYIGYLVQRYLIGVPLRRSPAATPGEQRWFISYAVSSYVYRTYILAVIILLVAGQFFFFGVLLAIWAATSLFVLPVLRHIRFLLYSPSLLNQRVRAVTLTVFSAAIILGGLMWLPVPLVTYAQGVTWLPDRAKVRVGADGFVTRVLVEPNSLVTKGAALFEMADPFLETELILLEGKLAELRARYEALQHGEKQVQAQMLREDMATVEADLARAQQRQRALRLRSPADGIFSVEQPEDLPGRYLRQGDLLGYVIENGNARARVVVRQPDVGLVRTSTERVEVRLAERLSDSIAATMLSVVPAASHRLPSPALGAHGGGPITTDPQDADGLRTTEKVFQVELALSAAVKAIGERVHVRFHHGCEPIGRQWYRRLRQLFLKRFHA